MNGSLPRALAVTLGLVGIYLAHAFEQFLRIGFIHFRGTGPLAPAAATRGHGPVFLSLVWHTININIALSTHSARTTSQKIGETQVTLFASVIFDKLAAVDRLA
jgi:hypothetical protein